MYCFLGSRLLEVRCMTCWQNCFKRHPNVYSLCTLTLICYNGIKESAKCWITYYRSAHENVLYHEIVSQLTEVYMTCPRRKSLHNACVNLGISLLCVLNCTYLEIFFELKRLLAYIQRWLVIWFYFSYLIPSRFEHGFTTYRTTCIGSRGCCEEIRERYQAAVSHKALMKPTSKGL